MPTIRARIATDRPGRYLRQFGKHASAMASPRGHRMRMHGGNPIANGDIQLRVDWTDTVATVHFDPWGRCVLRAEADALVILIEAVDDQGLQQIRDTIARDLERFGRGALVADWQELDDSDPADV